MAKKVPVIVQNIRGKELHREPNSKSISFSQLSLYVTCPNRWYRAYVKNEAPYTPSIHTVFGTSVHETIQRWLDILYNDSVKASEAFDVCAFLLERLRVNYEHDRKTLGKDFSSQKELEEFYQDGIAILNYVRKHRKSFFSTKKVYLVGCEIPLLYKLKDRMYFKGFIDVLTYDEELDRWKIWDIKTSTQGWSADTKKDFVKTSQLLLYREFLAKQFDLDPAKIDVEYFIVKRKIPADIIYPVQSKRVQEFIPGTGPRVSKKASALVESFVNGAIAEDGSYQDREYETTPSIDSCKWCLFRDSCKDVIK